MNVRLQYDAEFLAGIYIDNSLQLNKYSVSMNLVTKDTGEVVGIAMERLKAFLYGILENTVFIHQENEAQAEMLQVLGVNVTTLPEEPIDQIIGIMLYCKLNAIMEGRMMVTALDISSELGDNIYYQHDEEDTIAPFNQDGWWHQSNTKHNNIDVEQEGEKIVRVVNHGWKELNLEWPEEPTDKPANTIVYGKFTKNEN